MARLQRGAAKKNAPQGRVLSKLPARRPEPLDFFGRPVPTAAQVMQVPLTSPISSRASPGNLTSNDIKVLNPPRNSPEGVRQVLGRLGPVSQSKLQELTAGQIGQKALRKQLKALETKGEIERYSIPRVKAKSQIGYRIKESTK